MPRKDLREQVERIKFNSKSFLSISALTDRLSHEELKEKGVNYIKVMIFFNTKHHTRLRNGRKKHERFWGYQTPEAKCCRD